MSRPSIPYCSSGISGIVVCLGYTIRVTILKVYCVIYISAQGVINWGNIEDPPDTVTVVTK